MNLKSTLLLLLLCLPALVVGQSSLTLKEVRFIFESKEVSGTIGEFNSTSQVDLENLGQSTFKGSVGVESLKTGNFLRDWALKGRKYFNVSEFPSISFESNEVSEIASGFEVRGQLTMKGISKPLTIVFQTNGNILEGQAQLFTSDYDINIKKKREENKVDITLVLQLE